MNGDIIMLILFALTLIASAIRASQGTDGSGWGVAAFIAWVVLMFRGCS